MSCFSTTQLEIEALFTSPNLENSNKKVKKIIFLAYQNISASITFGWKDLKADVKSTLSLLLGSHHMNKAD